MTASQPDGGGGGWRRVNHAGEWSGELSPVPPGGTLALPRSTKEHGVTSVAVGGGRWRTGALMVSWLGLPSSTH